MMVQRSFPGPLILLLPAIWLVSACSNTSPGLSPSVSGDGKYDSEFPSRSTSRELKNIARSVKQVNYLAYYKSFLFPEELDLTAARLTPAMFDTGAIDRIYYNETASGTATVIYFDTRRIALLTCAHIGHMADTVYNYYPADGQNGDTILQSVALKEREFYYVNAIPGGMDLEIIARDEKRDLAILGRAYGRMPEVIPRVFTPPIGRSGDLQWGSFVYVIGFPMGYQMVTRGIVSKPRGEGAGPFMIDALFNRGFSGGLILAIRDGVPNFELVGLAKSLSASSTYLLSPAQEELRKYNPNLPYTGDLYPQMVREMNYGVTFAIPVETIRDFLQKNHATLLEKGYDFRPRFQY